MIVIRLLFEPMSTHGDCQKKLKWYSLVQIYNLFSRDWEWNSISLISKKAFCDIKE